jgi:hypothetical protein
MVTESFLVEVDRQLGNGSKDFSKSIKVLRNRIVMTIQVQELLFGIDTRVRCSSTLDQTGWPGPFLLFTVVGPFRKRL